MSAVLLMNIPLMVLAFGAMVGIPLWHVIRHHDWHGKHDVPAVPAYIEHQRREPVTRQRPVRARRPVRTVADW